MNTNNVSSIIYPLVALAVIVLVIATVAIPVIQDVQDDQKSVDNNVSERYMAMDDGGTVSFSIVDSEPAMNGEKLSTIFGTPTENTSYWVVSNDVSLMATYIPASTTWISWKIHYWDEDNNIARQTTLSGTSTVECSNGVIEYKSGDTVNYSWNYTFLLVPSLNGDYGAYSRGELSSVDCFVDDDSIIYIRSVGNNGNYTMAHGKISDITIDLAVTSYNKIEGAAVTCTYTPTEYEASNKLTNVVATPNTVSMGSGAWVLVPIEYTVITNDQNMLLSLIGIIPILLCIVPVMFAIRMIGSKN